MKLAEFKRIVVAWPDHEDAEVWIDSVPGGFTNLVKQVMQLGQHDVIVCGDGTTDLERWAKFFDAYDVKHERYDLALKSGTPPCIRVAGDYADMQVQFSDHGEFWRLKVEG